MLPRHHLHLHTTRNPSLHLHHVSVTGPPSAMDLAGSTCTNHGSHCTNHGSHHSSGTVFVAIVSQQQLQPCIFEPAVPPLQASTTCRKTQNLHHRELPSPPATKPAHLHAFSNETSQNLHHFQPSFMSRARCKRSSATITNRNTVAPPSSSLRARTNQMQRGRRRRPYQ